MYLSSQLVETVVKTESISKAVSLNISRGTDKFLNIWLKLLRMDELVARREDSIIRQSDV